MVVCRILMNSPVLPCLNICPSPKNPPKVTDAHRFQFWHDESMMISKMVWTKTVPLLFLFSSAFISARTLEMNCHTGLLNLAHIANIWLVGKCKREDLQLHLVSSCTQMVHAQIGHTLRTCDFGYALLHMTMFVENNITIYIHSWDDTAVET